MAATRYLGYVGGVAVAVGVGATIAVAGQPAAHADSGDGAAKDSARTSQHVKAGPKRAETKRAKPLAKSKPALDKQAGKSANAVAKAVTATPKHKPSAEEFEAEQVTKLKNLFAPKRTTVPEPKPETEPAPKSAASPKLSAVQTRSDTVDAQTETPAETPWNPNPFRADDPDPTDFPDAIMSLRQALLTASPDELDPFVREATEQIYRGSQIVPWVNAVIPIGKIIEDLAPAMGDTPDARAARQIIINELIKTTPPGSFLYYGYDIAADLLNLEVPGQALKEQAVTTVWDLLDPFELAHNLGESGIGNAAG
ncbi:hypothetical protein FR943_08510 [Mycobacterium sp. TNTM28]|uniref:Uncharacterized protein n=1 Tax=[Mycobacterium] fortunisiensis TaxID=2600579 RepID=A0ABS6KJX8_9MYCO|nr:hypothetical protein [[Mycobacterium] fortunisiensis]MBU9763882.1 hypothetical protein [[Mycobacterium] fortunisiensis]